ncbi:Uncharacterized protein APZ42_018740 [Daphnia magna]|uniref:Uncharacterized protein n=1 Tax=Daphnia magna TaxID=35525 RepID=A0A164YSA6_9CRUS|nr:Uncharacterized protein APZ42_018740 [Daphnia magna]
MFRRNKYCRLFTLYLEDRNRDRSTPQLYTRLNFDIFLLGCTLFASVLLNAGSRSKHCWF